MCLKLVDGAPDKRQVMMPFVAYQYITVLHNLASLKKGARPLQAEAKTLRYLLNESENSKVRLIRTADRLLGFEGMLLALRCRHWLLRGK